MGNRSNINLVGNTTTGQNLGDGACIFKCKSNGNNLQFKTISATGSTQIFETADKLVIFSAGGSGTTYTFSNGLTQNITAISLGGNLTQDTLISGGSLNCDFSIMGVTNLTLGSLSGMYLCGLPSKSTETCAVYIAADGKLATGLAGEGGGGTVTGATNLGNGNGTIYTSLSNKNLQFKTLSGGSNVTLTCNGNYIAINSTGSITGGTNGLSTTGKQIKLGGTLTGTTTISGTGRILNLNVSDINLSGNTVDITGVVTLQSTPATGIASDAALVWNSSDKQIKQYPISGITGGFLGVVTQTTAEPTGLKNNQWVKPAPTSAGVFNYSFTNFCDNTATPIAVNLVCQDVYLRYHESGDYWSKESYNRPITSGYTWIGKSGNTICEVPVIDEWVTSEAALSYMGQKFSYPTHSVFMSDVATCSLIPNYVVVKNICMKNIASTLVLTIPAGKTVLLNKAKLIFLNDATPTGMAVSMGNNCCSNCYNNLIARTCIDDVLTNEIYELPLSCNAICINTGIAACCCAPIYFRVQSGSTSVNNLCAHLLVEGFLF